MKVYIVNKYEYILVSEDENFYSLYDKDWDCIRKFPKFKYGICSKGKKGDECLEDKDLI